MSGRIYGMDVIVWETATTIEGVPQTKIAVYENTFYFNSDSMRRICANRVRNLPNVEVKFFSHREHAPQVVKRMVINRTRVPYES